MSHLLPHSRLLRAVLTIIAIAVCAEVYNAYTIYRNATAARDSLLAIQNDIDIANLGSADDQVAAARPRLQAALQSTKEARSSLSHDPLIFVAAHTPVIGKQVRGLQTIVEAAQGLEEAGLMAVDISDNFNKRVDDPNLSSVQEAVDFVKAAERRHAAGQRPSSSICSASAPTSPTASSGRSATASTQVDDAIEKRMHEAVIGYARADALLPRLLGYNGAKRYLLLPQNDTELFPSGGLISSYAIVTFDKGDDQGRDSSSTSARCTTAGRPSQQEYIEPPAPPEDAQAELQLEPG